MNILFVNLYNIGDTHFSQPFIENIVRNNKDHNFFLYCKFNYIIFKEILNLKILENIDHILLVYISHNNVLPYFYIPINNILIINTWAGAYVVNNHVPDSDLVSLTKRYYNCIDTINQELKINLKYDIELKLPRLPNINIDKIIEFKDAHKDKKILFYYNYMPESGQGFPLKSMDEHDDIILHLEKLNYKILIPKLSEKLSSHETNNIIDCNKYFNLTEDNLCTNIYFYTYITMYSDIVIYYDSGRSFTYIHNNISTNNIKIHIGYFKREIK